MESFLHWLTYPILITVEDHLVCVFLLMVLLDALVLLGEKINRSKLVQSSRELLRNESVPYTTINCLFFILLYISVKL